MNRYSTQQFITAILSVLAFFCICGAANVNAASISFDPQETTVGMASPFLVAVKIDAETSINAMRLVISIPDSMDVIDVSDGNSLINLWVERPRVTDARQIVFSGIIPGGFVGTGGTLVTLKVQAKQEGKFSIFLDPSSRIYENSATAVTQDITSRPVELSVAQGRDNILNEIPDTVAPEHFVPQVILLEDEAGSHWAVSFETQDKRSGINSYAVAESVKDIAINDTSRLEGLDWQMAESPYHLNDQKLSSFIYIKAVDKKGNTRYERLLPRYPQAWYEVSRRYILVVSILFLVLYALTSTQKKKATVRR